MPLAEQFVFGEASASTPFRDLTQNPQINVPLTQSPQMTMPLAEQYLVGDEPASASISSRATEKCFKKRESNAIKKLTRKLHEMRQKCKMQSKKIRLAKKLTLSKSFLATIEKLPDAAQIFIKLQLKGTKKPRGRRYTRNEKIMALSIYKQSPKAYNLLKKMFILPSKRCLQKIQYIHNEFIPNETWHQC
ncbi:uncharacterized protein LOC124636044 [Helicoverpa zea]|uniref:uncharacterized protein LOC124636044 n=1 Tax=Helicoverpa zea TaxID=7113 RepID=UPI001F57692B|nr:uncharacterized protein LOC124636044 [Helicoverpa zea]